IDLHGEVDRLASKTSLDGVDASWHIHELDFFALLPGFGRSEFSAGGTAMDYVGFFRRSPLLLLFRNLLGIHRRAFRRRAFTLVESNIAVAVDRESHAQQPLVIRAHNSLHL